MEWIKILTLTFAIISMVLAITSLFINVKAYRRAKKRLLELQQARDDAFERLTEALNEFASAFSASEAFEELRTQIMAAYFGYKQPQPRPPKSIDPTICIRVRHVTPRARSCLRGTKRR